VSHSTVTLLFA